MRTARSRMLVSGLIAFTLLGSPGAMVTGDEQAIFTTLAPGIVVEELPLRLPNINNLRFRADGQLTALGYNGKVYILNDTDRDGLPDAAETYWDRPTLRVPVGMAWSEQGLYVSSQGKLSLLRDTTGDGRADLEEIVSAGWPAPDVRSGGVDATSVTLDRQGNVYFALICANYSNPYRLDNGKAKYSHTSLRGTILRLSSDHKQRDVIATGLRVPYTLAFNRHGDLFCTDQEGETWLPGGNPLDELNQILPGRHYGFPPRHDAHLPDVLDEPPVVAFGPQHQSTCGLVFNEAREGWKSFGPPAWEGTALVAGLSRGRLWRVPLVKTPHGYVGRPVAVAVSSMLLADLAVSPEGHLYLTCHSGPPDWGTGPDGEGRLFRLRYVADKAATPVFACATGPLEVKVAFDRPVAPEFAEHFKGRTIRYGEHVRAGDHHETLKPPYAAVERQAESHRGELTIAGARLSDDRRTVTLQTSPHPLTGTYSLPLPIESESTGAAQRTAIEVEYDLSGLSAKWTPHGGDLPTWTGWVPHADLAIARALITDSAEHQALFSLLDKAGQLQLSGFLELPDDATMLRVTSSVPSALRLGERGLMESVPEGNSYVAAVDVADETGRQPLEVVITCDGGETPKLNLSYRRVGDDNERVVELNRLSLPWSPQPSASRIAPSEQQPSKVVGDPRRGELIFFGQVAKCADCHSIHGRGQKFAPELDSLWQRSAESVLRDIRDPNATINPDFLGYTILLADGRVLNVTARSVSSDKLLVVSQESRQSTISISDIEELRPLSTSMMPTGLLDALGPSDVQDLLAFLASPPPRDKELPEFPQRTAAEVTSALAALSKEPKAQLTRPTVITLIAGKKDHGQGEHDYPAWQASWAELLREVEGVKVQRAVEWPTPEEWRTSEVMVFNLWNHEWSPEQFEQLDAYLARGGGVVVLHAALISDGDPESLAKRWGLAAQPKRTKYRHGPVTLQFSNDNQSPLVAGYSRLPLVDESYWPLIGDRQRVSVLATAVEEDAEWPMIWTYQPGRGRVWASVMGHYSATLEDPLYRILVLRGIAWAGNRDLQAFQQGALR